MKNKLKIELQRILGAFLFYTRIPFPSKYFSKQDSNSSRYFTLVGLIVGMLSVSVLIIPQIFITFIPSLSSWNSSPITILIVMLAAVLLTGALHEDGFADTCDGVLGGYNIEKRLKIMKDSRIGTYGSVGLVFLILLKFFALLQIEIEILPLVWVGGNAYSRFISILQIRFANYVQDSKQSKSKSMTDLSRVDLIVNAFFGLLPLLLIVNIVFIGLIGSLIVGLFTLYYFKKKLGGVTGDSLGATQQISEVIFYLCI